MDICKICNNEVTAENHFWRAHKLKQIDYYLQYHPRFSKQTGEPIKFKSKEFYLNNDFNTKTEMMSWLKNQDNPISHVMELIKKRKESKNLVFAPSQVELKSSMLPSMEYMEELGGYNAMCADAELKIKFDALSEPEYKKINGDTNIVIDTREQKPFAFPGYPIVYRGLKYGDYALEPNRFKVHIERKELKDFISTVGNQFDRFSREIQRAKKEKAYLIVLVESSFSTALTFNHIPFYKKIIKATPDFVMHNMRNIMQTYDNIQFVFCNTKDQARDMVLKIFGLKKHPKHFDLEYYKDIGKL